MKKVLVVMGSDSDYGVMEACFKQLKQFGLDFDAEVCSAHRSPERAAALAGSAEGSGYGVIIAAAGMAAHLPGVLAAFTCLPVIGVPVAAGALGGVDALLAEVQMPPGIPVATVAVDGAMNAAVLAAQILALGDDALRGKLAAFKEDLRAKVEVRSRALKDKLKGSGYLS